MKTGLAGKVVLITGATRNHGRAGALAFAEEGAHLLLVGHITPARHDFHPEWCSQVRSLFQQIHALTRTEE